MTNQEFQFRCAVEDAGRFYFKEVDNNNINRMSVHFVVEDISYKDFMVKMSHTSASWADDL